MYIFFLIINFIFGSIFYIFGKNIEAIFFTIIGILMFFYFSPLYFGKKSEKQTVFSKLKISKEDVKKTLPLIQKLSYILASIFFYLSIYGISYGIGGKESRIFDYIILFIGLFLFSGFFIFFKKQKEVFNLVFRSNFIVLGIFYIILFIKNLLGGNIIDYLFIINSSISLIGLIITICFDKLFNIKRKSFFYIFYLFYQSFFLFFYIRYYFLIPYYFLFPYLFLFLGIPYFEYFQKIIYFKKFEIPSKMFGILIIYISTILSFIFLFIISDFGHYILILLISSLFYYFTHIRFKNYFSLELLILSVILIYIKFFIPIDFSNFYLSLIFIFSLPALFIGISYLLDKKYEFDFHFLHFNSIIFSFSVIVIYFIKSFDSDILHISILLLFSSILLFSSFARIKSK